MDVVSLPPTWQAILAAMQMAAADLPAEPSSATIDLAADGSAVVTADDESVELSAEDIARHLDELVASDSLPPPPPVPEMG